MDIWMAMQAGRQRMEPEAATVPSGAALLARCEATGLQRVTPNGNNHDREGLFGLRMCPASGWVRENRCMQELANSYAFWIFVFVALVVVYLLPTLIGMIRGVERLALVFLVNLIGAPTGIGWLAALILAFGPRRMQPAPPWPVPPGAAYGPGGAWVPGPRDFG
jgi:hypothetical protein